MTLDKEAVQARIAEMERWAAVLQNQIAQAQVARSQLISVMGGISALKGLLTTRAEPAAEVTPTP